MYEWIGAKRCGLQGEMNKAVFLSELAVSPLLAFTPVQQLLTSANGKFCVCTVPSLHLFRRAHFLAPPRLLLHPSHSYWPQPQSTAGRPGTEKQRKENRLDHNYFIQSMGWSVLSCFPEDCVIIALYYPVDAFTVTYRYPFSFFSCVFHQLIYFNLKWWINFFF